MKTLRLPLALLLIGSSLLAQNPAIPPPITTVPANETKRTPEELEQLLAPIALYPDALIAVILPASTVPTDIVLAARHVQENPGDRSQIEHRAWDDSVKSLTSYPEVLKWLDENLHWTRQVGEAFAEQPAEVMQAIQRLRAKARAAGTLVDTPQQQVLAEPEVIRIVPAQPDIIYVPRYEPDVVFVDRPVYYTRPFLTFGVGVAVGSWLAYDCDWRRHTIWMGNRHRHWTRHNWHHPVVPHGHVHSYNRSHAHSTHRSDVRPWSPPDRSRRHITSGHRFRSEIARPGSLNVTATRTYPYRRDDNSHRNSSNAPRVVPSLPHSSADNHRRELAGPRPSSSSITSSRASSHRQELPRVTMPNLQPLPQARHSVDPSPRPSDSPARSFRRSPSASIRPSQPNVPSLPMATPSTPRASVGPSRSFSRSAPAAAAAAPAVVPSLPMASRSSSTPATVGPAPASSSQPQSAQRDSNSRGTRGHRGGGGYSRGQTHAN